MSAPFPSGFRPARPDPDGRPAPVPGRAHGALLARDLVMTYGDRRVLDGVSLTAAPGRRYGVVGENGVGKSTLLRLLAGVEEPDSGEVVRPPSTGYLPQELPYGPGARVGDVLADALADARATVARVEALAQQLAVDPDDTVLDAYGRAVAEAERREAWEAERRARLVLAGLGVAGLDEDRPLGTLSGGQQSRLGLAALLVRRPDAVILDEPTNHLDDDAVGFLSERLRALPGVVVVATHDRVFLDEVCTDVCDLDPSRDGPDRGGLTRYGGAYHAYLAAKRAERRRWEQAYADEQAGRVALRLAVATTARRVAPNRGPRDNDKLGYTRHGARVEASVSIRVRNARRRLEVLDRDPVPRPPDRLQFRGVLPSRRAGGEGPVLSVREVMVPGRLRLDRLDVLADGRLLVTGPNAAGKSTLLAVLAGELPPARGVVRRRRGVHVGLLPQDVRFTAPGRTAEQVYDASVRHRGDPPPLTDLGLLHGRDLRTPVDMLSVGQRRRLALAVLVADAPDVLLLDEPTNHVSLTLAEELEDALASAPGAVVVATHDRWLRRRWAGPVLALTGGRVTS